LACRAEFGGGGGEAEDAVDQVGQDCAAVALADIELDVERAAATGACRTIS
jgi:hypothetical protein